MRAHLFGPGNQPLARQFLTASVTHGTWPLLLCVGGALSCVGVLLTNRLLLSPDARVNKLERKVTLRHNEAEGRRWIKNHATMRSIHGGSTRGDGDGGITLLSRSSRVRRYGTLDTPVAETVVVANVN